MSNAAIVFDVLEDADSKLSQSDNQALRSAIIGILLKHMSEHDIGLACDEVMVELMKYQAQELEAVEKAARSAA